MGYLLLKMGYLLKFVGYRWATLSQIEPQAPLLVVPLTVVIGRKSTLHCIHGIGTGVYFPLRSKPLTAAAHGPDIRP